MQIDINREFVDSREGFTTEDESAYFALQSIDRGDDLLEWMEELWNGFPATPPQYFRISHASSKGAKQDMAIVAIGTLKQARAIQGRGRILLAIDHVPGYTPIVESREEHCDSEARYSRE